MSIKVKRIFLAWHHFLFSDIDDEILGDLMLLNNLGINSSNYKTLDKQVLRCLLVDELSKAL